MAKTAIVTGATGQDGSFLVHRLLDEGWRVHAAVRDLDAARSALPDDPGLSAVEADLGSPDRLVELIAELEPDEFYNLAGESSVQRSFENPRVTWETNAHVMLHLLDAVRCSSPRTRFYQASSGEMFGSTPGGDVVHDELSALNPQSPYAAAKAAAHMLCRSYRESYGVRIACGILFNHESHRRGASFLSRKVVDHLLRETNEPLRVGNLKSQRDWGFAPEYVAGMQLVLRQTDVRGVADDAHEYRDYVLGTGRLHAVWELIDTAFRLADRELVWELDGDDPSAWCARDASSGATAVEVDPAFVRPSDPRAIAADPSRIRRELGWEARSGLDVFLRDMLEH
ncbi:MAG TPA: GDP-mannose 4,6-dehydratase [Gaiellaceae bacterium]|jgi:GDPmannose 4,6-dehydratase|nr:GDP-mannose 4,6-dehydratase [Gaiellaceae bacterium]